MNKVKFGDLSWPLKTLVVIGWILSGLYGSIFLLGFAIGILEGM